MGRRRALFCLLAVVLGIGAVEVAVRVLYADEIDTDLLRQREEAGRLDALMRRSADPVLYYETRPGLEKRLPNGALVLTDAEGVRVRREPRAPAPHDRPPARVAVVGASTTFGMKIDLEDTWPERLAPRLEALWERPVRVRNFSVPAYNAIQQARLFETRVLPWEPDLVLWHYDHRDAFPALGPEQPIAIPADVGDNPLGSAALKLLLRRMHESEVAELRRDADDAFEIVDFYLAGGSAYDAHLAALRAAGARARAAGVPVVLVVFDAFVRRGRSADTHRAALHDPLVPALEAAGFVVVDLLDDLHALMEERGWRDLRAFWLSVTPLDGHPNPEGHRFLAERVGAFLEGAPELRPD